MIWGEIYALDNEFGCVASNEHFMEMFGFSNDRKAQRLIKGLREKGYITVEHDKRKDTRVMHVVGKFRHLDKQHMSDLEAMRNELLGKFTR